MYLLFLSLRGPRISDSSVTVKMSHTQILVFKFAAENKIKKSRLLRKTKIPGLGQGKHNMSQEYLILPESKEAPKE